MYGTLSFTKYDLYKNILFIKEIEETNLVTIFFLLKYQKLTFGSDIKIN